MDSIIKQMVVFLMLGVFASLSYLAISGYKRTGGFKQFLDSMFPK